MIKILMVILIGGVTYTGLAVVNGSLLSPWSGIVIGVGCYIAMIIGESINE